MYFGGPLGTESLAVSCGKQWCKMNILPLSNSCAFYFSFIKEKLGLQAKHSVQEDRETDFKENWQVFRLPQTSFYKAPSPPPPTFFTRLKTYSLSLVSTKNLSRTGKLWKPMHSNSALPLPTHMHEHVHTHTHKQLLKICKRTHPHTWTSTPTHTDTHTHTHTAYLFNTGRAPPVPFGHIWQGRDETVCVESVITTVTQQHELLTVPTGAHATVILVHLCKQLTPPWIGTWTCQGHSS